MNPSDAGVAFCRRVLRLFSSIVFWQLVASGSVTVVGTGLFGRVSTVDASCDILQALCAQSDRSAIKKSERRAVETLIESSFMRTLPLAQHKVLWDELVSLWSCLCLGMHKNEDFVDAVVQLSSQPVYCHPFLGFLTLPYTTPGIRTALHLSSYTCLLSAHIPTWCLHLFVNAMRVVNS